MRYLFIFLLFLVFSCKKENNKLFALKANNKSGLTHQNQISSSEELNVFKYRNFYNGGGVAIGDINNDGLADIYFSVNMGPNKLYLNKGDLTFEDITEKAGVTGTKPWSTGVNLVDINNDGYLDIYVSNAGILDGSNRDNELFINQQDGTFKEEASSYNLAQSGISTHAAFLDYDLDGDLDVYLLNNSFIPVTSLGYNNKRDLNEVDWKIHPQYKGGGDRFLENKGGWFEDVTDKANIFNSLIGFGLGVTTGDVNKDGYPDLYISNDFYERDYLYINQKDGSFKESLTDWANHISHSSMGSDMSDINNDGFLDVFVTDMLPESHEKTMETTEFEGVDVYKLKQRLGFYHQFMQNTLQINNQNDSFSEIAYQAGIAKTDWSWGALMFDMNSDGYKDIFVANGIYHELTNQDFMNYFANDVIGNLSKNKKESVIDIVNKMPSRPISNYSFKNNINDTKFEDFSKEWGLDHLSFSNGAAYGDLDNDGDLDLVVNNVNMPVFLYENKSVDNGANYISISLKQEGKNNFAFGAKATIYYNNKKQFTELYPARGFQSSVDLKINFGLGKQTSIDSLKIKWPDWSVQTIINPKINMLHSITKEKNLDREQTEISTLKTALSKVEIIGLNKHIENNYVDYDYEVTIPESLSREGPGVAIGDVNGDGLDDIFLGNAAGYTSALYLQNKNGSYSILPNKDIEAAKEQEDVVALFFDVDQDDDLDLYVGTGGNEDFKGNQVLYDRIYLNDGKGNFSVKKDALPNIPTNTSVIAPNDFDNDGDIDLFIGNRSVSGIYGITPKSYFLRNDGDAFFTDVTDSFGKAASEYGMITDAKWVNFSSDNYKDLLIVGDWIGPTFFSNNGYSLSKHKTNLENLKGWWNTIITGDFNNDFLVDFIFGNKGENTPLTGTELEKIKLFINDFDLNGNLDKIITIEINGKNYPISVKKELEHQLPILRKNTTSYEIFAKKTVEDLLGENAIKNSIVKTINESKSILAIQYKNDFQIKALNDEVQRNSVNSGISKDIDQDGNLDLLLFGGDDHFKPQFSKQDAGFGELLFGNGKGDFRWQPYFKSGLKVKGVVKKVALHRNSKEIILIFKNNDLPEAYYFNK